MFKAQSVLVVSALMCSFNICEAQLQPLSYRPIATRYSTPLDRLVTISSGPNILHIYDPLSTNDVTVGLPKAPLSLGLSPDGMYAAVGFDGNISIVSLSAASIINTFSVAGQATSLLLSDTSILVAGQNGLAALNIQSGVSQSGAGPFNTVPSSGVFNLTQDAVYLSQDGYSPNDMQKYVLNGAGQFVGAGGWPYHGDYPDCSPYYLSADGSRIYTSCQTVAHASTDKTLDMYYLRTLPVSSAPIAGLSEAPSSKLLAAIPSTYSYSASSATPPDTQVQLFQTDYLNPVGSIALLPIATPSGSFAAHGKAVFFSSDASRLIVLAQADTTSNLANPFAVEVINLANTAACSVSFSSAPLAVPSGGSYGALAITAVPGCFYAASTDASWITLSNGAYGAGNGTLQWIVRPNSSNRARTGTIVINGQIYTIEQSAAPVALPSPAPLSFNIVDADYSASLDRIIAVSASPDEVHVYDPVAQADRVVPLIMPPFSVSVAPDGLHAAVGHDGWISYIDLKAGTVLQTFQIVTDVHHVVLAGNGYIYAFPQRDWSDIYSLQISTGKVTAASAIYEGRIPRLEPDGKYFYAIGGQWFSKWDITGGVAVSIFDSPGSAPGYNMWLYQDGTHYVGSAGKVYSSSDVKSQDNQYIGSFPNGTSVQWAANSSALHSTAVIPLNTFLGSGTADTRVEFFGDAYLGAAGSIPLPQFSAGGKDFAAHGLFAFWNSLATSLFIIQRADNSANLLSTDAVYTISPSSPPAGCTATPLGAFATLPAGGGYGGAPVSAGIGCPWSAISDSSWLAITAGAIGGGSANISWSATANTGTASRTAKITIGGMSYPITQLGTSATPLALSPGALSFSTTFGSATAIAAQSFSVKTGTAPFTVAANPSWVTAMAGASNTYSVAVNPANLPAGTNIGAVTVTSADGQVQFITVTLTVTPNLVASLTSLNFQYGPADPLPTASLTLADGSTGTTSFTVQANPYLTAKASSNTLPTTVQVTPLATLGPGTYSATIVIYAANQSISIPVKITHTGATVSVTAITDAANFSQGAVSPGEIVVIWGGNLGPATLTSFTLFQNRLPTSLAGTSVSFNQYQAPIIYTSTGAVSVIVPYGLGGQTTANVSVSFNGSVSAQFTQPLAPTAPHFFTKSYQAVGQIVALNSDSSVNSTANPAPAGSVVVLYATGEGVTSPPGIDGSLVGSTLTQPLANVTVTIGGQPANVLYAGGSPGSIEGLLQINVRIPAGTPPGNAPVTLVVGAGIAPSGATVAVAP